MAIVPQIAPVNSSGTAVEVRPAAGARSVATSDTGAIRELLPVDPISPDTTSFLFRERRQNPEQREERAPQSFFGVFSASTQAFAAALDIQRADEGGNGSGRFSGGLDSRSFSGLLVRAINLYEDVSRIGRGVTVPRGETFNLNS